MNRTVRFGDRQFSTSQCLTPTTERETKQPNDIHKRSPAARWWAVEDQYANRQERFGYVTGCYAAIATTYEVEEKNDVGEYVSRSPDDKYHDFCVLDTSSFQSQMESQPTTMKSCR